MEKLPPVLQKGDVIRLNNLEVMGLLGQGSFGQVYKVHCPKTKEDLALKVCVSPYRTIQQSAMVEAERTKMLSSTDPGSSVVEFITAFRIYSMISILLKMEKYALDKWLEEFHPNGVGPTHVTTMARTLLSGLLHLRNQKIMHTDIKMENILVRNDDGVCVISDFGLAMQAPNPDKPTRYKNIQDVHFRAPENILDHPADCSMDMWSAGLVILRAAFPAIVFNSRREDATFHTFRNILMVEPDNDFLARCHKRSTYYQKINGCYIYNSQNGNEDFVILPGYRLLLQNWGSHTQVTFDSLLKLVRFKCLLLGMLEWNPRRRILPENALQHMFFGASLVTNHMF